MWQNIKRATPKEIRFPSRSNSSHCTITAWLLQKFLCKFTLALEARAKHGTHTLSGKKQQHHLVIFYAISKLEKKKNLSDVLMISLSSTDFTR